MRRTWPCRRSDRGLYRFRSPPSRSSGAPRADAAARRWLASREMFRRWRSLPLAVIDVLAKHDCHPIDISYTKFSNSIRLIGWLQCNHRTAAHYFSVVSVDILDPLKQMDAARVSIVSNEVNCRIVAPHYRVPLVTEIPREPEDITIERCCRFNVRDMQYRRTLNELCRIGRWQWRHASSYCIGTSRTIQPGTGAIRPYGVPAPVAWLMAR